ncbi:hypothetical protein CHUAL_000180 [Chamberlinius hualienensis]
MTGYLFIIVLVTLSSQQWNTLALSLLPEVTVPYYTYDNACTRITPAVPANQTLGENYVRYSTIKDLESCTSYLTTWEKGYFQRSIHKWVSLYRVRYRSYENPTKPGEMQDYPSAHVIEMSDNSVEENPNEMEDIKHQVLELANGIQLYGDSHQSCSLLNGAATPLYY